MTGSDFLATETDRQSIERSKLQTTVTRNARDRRLAAEITGDEWLDYVMLEIAFEVQHVKRKVELFGNAAGIVNVVE
jgi:hypothetical protein